MPTYAMVGLGSRCDLYIEALTKKYRSGNQIVAICDSNPGRLKSALCILKSKGIDVIPYPHSDFDLMLNTYRPSCVIVCCPDKFHDFYICRAMKSGCDVITEKPMTIDAPRCRNIISTVRQTGQKLRVTFNYRYSPPRSQVKELLLQGVIGDIYSIDFQWLLDTYHGADYFRRWHRRKENSGGLLVHKSTHHFDLVNWWLDDIPSDVFARGGRFFYTEKQADNLGLKDRGMRCCTCPANAKCSFYLDMSKFSRLKQLYLENEHYDNYFRDQCVFSPDINIEDCMQVSVRYRKGTVLNYSLNAFMPWEGYRIAFNGSKGRLEHECREKTIINGEAVSSGIDDNGMTIRVLPHFGPAIDVPVIYGEGGHFGGDESMIDDLFGPNSPDPLKRKADCMQGAYSILTGIAANASISTSRPVLINELLNGDAFY